MWEKRSEQAISRVLFPLDVAIRQVAIIYLGRRLPGASCDLTRRSRTSSP